MENVQPPIAEAEEDTLDKTLTNDEEEIPSDNLSTSTKEEITVVEDQKSSPDVNPETELPEGVEYYPPPDTSSRQSIPSSAPPVQNQRSTTTVRWNALSRPKAHVLKDTLEQFEGLLPERSTENLRKQLQDQNHLIQSLEREHLKKCTAPSVPQPPSGRRPPSSVTKERRDEMMKKFNSKLKREAFDRLAGKIFEKLPELVLDADISNLEQLPPSMQQMINVLFGTLVGYAGKPLTCHDHELYVHTSFGLARFIEGVVSAVQNRDLEKGERVPKHAKVSLRNALFADLSLLDTQKEV